MRKLLVEDRDNFILSSQLKRTWRTIPPRKEVNPKENMDKDEKNIKNTTPQSETPQEEKSAKNESEPESLEKITGGKFKTPDSLAKAYSELEKKLGEQGDELKQAREFATIVQPMLDLARNDKEVFDLIDKKLQSQPDNPSNKDSKADNKDSESRDVLYDIIIESFETKHGISKMDKEKSREIRNQIGRELAEMTGGLTYKQVGLKQLPTVLEKAFTLATYKSGMTSTDSVSGDEDASISSIPSSPGKSEESLTPEEARVAEKMNLTREQYLEGKKRLAKK